MSFGVSFCAGAIMSVNRQPRTALEHVVSNVDSSSFEDDVTQPRTILKCKIAKPCQISSEDDVSQGRTILEPVGSYIDNAAFEKNLNQGGIISERRVMNLNDAFWNEYLL